jgi:hypothetical protein
MPQLSSGRHVCLSADHLLKGLMTGPDERKYYLLLVYRTTVTSPAKLRDHLFVGYGDGPPPDATYVLSPFTVLDVLEGRSDWTADEVAEFRTWLETNPAIGPYLEEQFAAINEVILRDPLWESDLVNGD